MVSIVIIINLLSLRRKTFILALLISFNLFNSVKPEWRSNCERILIINAGLTHVQKF